jgi:hypothetical protein
LLDEMCRRLFGAGSASARELLRLQCDRWEKTALSRPLRIGENRIPPRLFREIWPPDVLARMKALHSKALAEIERTGDAPARNAFLYWTWEFDAFVDYAEMVEKVISPGAEVTQSADASGAAANDHAAARFRGGTAEVNTIRTANVRHQDGPVEGQSYVQFDLSWGHTWRAKWAELAARNVTGNDLPVESWSAAWVFVKYKPAGRDAARPRGPRRSRRRGHGPDCRPD